MYVRRLQRPTTSFLCHLRSSTYKGASVAPLRRASKLSEKTSAAEEPKQQPNTKSKTSCDREEEEPKRGSIRPITVFAICIPLGYAIKWALKKEDEAPPGTSVDGFIRYTLASKEDVSSTCSIFTLTPSTPSTVNTDDPALKRAITSVQFKQPELQIARSYTLLPPEPGQGPHELRFLIRKERNGEVSGYLHRLPFGSQVELRGLCAEYVLPENINSVLYLAGGTGIAPAMQVAKTLAGEASVYMLWASRKREDCVGGISDATATTSSRLWTSFWLPSPGDSRDDAAVTQEKSTIVSQLEVLKERSSSDLSMHEQGRMWIEYYVDEEGTFMKPKAVAQLLRSINKATASKELTTKLLVVSGPEGFINHWAGPKQWADGREVQGPLGGVLSTLDLRGWRIIKL